MTPDDLHREVLAALDTAGDMVARATAAPWHVGAATFPTATTDVVTDRGGTVGYGMRWRDVRLVVGLRNTASAAYRGARRIIERHHPLASGLCAYCYGSEYAETGAFPCVDYRDAAAAIPHLPEGVARALGRAADVPAYVVIDPAPTDRTRRDVARASHRGGR